MSKDAEQQQTLPVKPVPGLSRSPRRARGAGCLPRTVPALHELLQPPSPCCWLLISLAVNEGMELSAEVKAVSKLSDSFCSWESRSARESTRVGKGDARQKRRFASEPSGRRLGFQGPCHLFSERPLFPTEVPGWEHLSN